MHLVEVLSAAGLLAAVCGSLPHAFAAAVRANLAAADVTWTSVLAAQKLEELRSQPFPEPAVLELHDLLDARGGPVAGPQEPVAYIRTWRTEPFAASPDRTIVITVVVSPYRYVGGNRGEGAAAGSTRLVSLRTRKAM